jgi:fumarylacetoacetate (FAA) hydrolase
MQAALDDWATLSEALLTRFNDLQAGNLAGEFAVDTNELASPLPRAYAWIDGSAYINHIVLVRKARGAEPPETLETDPLVYQGGSDTFLGPCDDIPWGDGSWGLDFESELAVITDDVPMGTKKEQASQHIKLIMLVNDVSLRGLIPPELKKGFGFYVSKPSTAFGPFAITPDELGDSLKDGRVHLDMLTDYKGEWYGNPNAGPEMHFSFHDLIEHCAKTRMLGAGTIIGSGTVSNVDRSRGSSCLAEKRMIEKIDTGEFRTPFMVPGDTVRIRMMNGDANLFGTIQQTVVAVD